MVLGPGMEDQPGMEEGVEVGIAMLTVMPDDPLWDFVLSILSIWYSAELAGLISQAGTSPGNRARVLLSYQVWLSHTWDSCD